jgi:pimeloyl-ACP methyl ester carboxylesterase
VGAGYAGFHLGLRFWPGSGPGKLALVHATGFCKEIWDPVVDDLRQRGFDEEAFGWDQRGHGESDEPELPADWWMLGRDALALLEAEDEPGIVGVGHSSGATALLMAEVTRPGVLAGIVAIEPIVFPPPYGVMDHPLAQRAERRRERFADEEAARVNFAEKFPDWDLRSLDCYLAGAFRHDGAEVVLRCRPEVEASYYRQGHAHELWDRLPEVTIPVLVVAGADSDSHPRQLIMAQAARMGAETALVEDSGHLLPMERPGAIAELTAGFWSELGAR